MPAGFKGKQERIKDNGKKTNESGTTPYSWSLARRAFIALALGVSLRGRKITSRRRPKIRGFPSTQRPLCRRNHEYLWVDQNREEPFTKDPSGPPTPAGARLVPRQPAPGTEPAFYVLDINEYPEKACTGGGVISKRTP